MVKRGTPWAALPFLSFLSPHAASIPSRIASSNICRSSAVPSTYPICNERIVSVIPNDSVTGTEETCVRQIDCNILASEVSVWHFGSKGGSFWQGPWTGGSARNGRDRSGGRSLFVEAAMEQVALRTLSGSEKGIAVITLNRPDARNAVGVEMLKQLRGLLESLQFHSSIRALILCSSVPGVFCAGADLKERRKMDISEAQKFVSSLRSTFASLEALSIPTIAVVEGVALGGGLELALACDLRVSGDAAVFGLPETSLAIIPGAGGTQRLPRLIGQARAKELIFTARRIDAQRAEEIGLVNYCVPAGNAYEKALGIAREINQQGPLAVKLAKVAIDRGSDVDTASGMVIEEVCYAQVLQSKDRLEGLAAFSEKRKPSYSGD